MKGPETDHGGSITNEFQEIKPGRRALLEFPLSLTFQCKFVAIVVLDSARVDTGNSADCSCAALIVPRGREKEWVYSWEGGQWQLLASAGVSRLILLFPKRDRVKFKKTLDELAAPSIEDEELKPVLYPLILALSPKVLFDRGIPDISFLNYSDNVVRRMEIEVAYSSLTGFMMVEDVELRPECEQQEESSFVSRISARSWGRERESPRLTKSSSTWRRRLIFQRMPNLIQTEVPLIAYTSQDVDHLRSSARERKKEKGSNSGRKKRVVDHSRLVHKYLPPIVAGFVLISPCLDELVQFKRKAKVLCIGVGGGALPTFLHNQFGFHVKVFDLDEVVLDLARRHFGLKEGPNFEVTAEDGLDAVTMIARRAVTMGFVHDQLQTKRSSFSDRKTYVNLPTLDSASEVAITAPEQILPTGEKFLSTAQEATQPYEGLKDSECRGESKFKHDEARDETTDENAATTRRAMPATASWSTTPTQQEEMDPRAEVIVVDVDVTDAKLGLASPPHAFLESKFLTSARNALKEGGMLVMNVIPSGRKEHEEVIEALAAVFQEVYEIVLENEAHHCVVFALLKPSSYPNLEGPTVDLVHRLVDGQLVRRIRRLNAKVLI